MPAQPWKAAYSLGLAGFLSVAPGRTVAAQEVDPSVTRLAWGPLNILVIPDSSNGLGLWAAWSAEGERRGVSRDEFVAHYDPGAVTGWIDEAQLLLLPDGASESDPAQLQTPPLSDLLNGRLFAVRLKDGRRWSNRVYFSMSYRPQAKPLQFAMNRDHATRFLEALGEGARRSRLIDTAVPGETRFYANPAEPSTFPQGDGVTGVLYPQYLVDQRIEGDVWFTFVVDSTGRVREDHRLRVLLSDHPLLTQTAKESLKDAKYRPARRLGRPVAVRIYQRVTYRIRN